MLRSAAAGLALLALHVAALPALLGRWQRPALALDLIGGGAALAVAPDGAFPDDARVPPGLAGRATLLVDGKPVDRPPERLAPGVHRVEWAVGYRGGHVRRVGRTVLAGPLQDPASPSCGVRLVVGQTLLDTLEPLLREQIAAGLDGQFGFQRVESLDLAFAVDPAGQGAIGVVAELVFSRGRVPIGVTLLPRLVEGELRLESRVFARVELDSRAAGKVIDWLGQTDRLNAYATDVARDEVDKALAPVTAFLAKPPPVELEGGKVLPLRYCTSDPVVIEPRGYLAVPLALPVPQGPGGLRPVRLDPGPPLGAPRTPIAIDVSVDAVNAVLFDLYASGTFDAMLDRAGLHDRFNAQPIVQELLTVRAGPARLAMPPTLEVCQPAPERPCTRPFTLALEAILDIQDGAIRTPARLYGRVGLELVTDGAGRLAADPAITELSVTCEPRPGRLEPCYAALMEEARGGSDVLHDPIARLLADWFAGLVGSRRLGGVAGAPTFTLGGAVLTRRLQKESGWLRLSIDGRIEP